MRRSGILFLLLSLTYNSFSQVTKNEFDFLSQYYNAQYKNLIRARGIDTVTYFSSKYINQNDPSKISGVLKKYFGESNAKIAALIYFYFDSTFFVFLADKNKVTKISGVKIPVEEVTGLNKKIINSLRLTTNLQDRAPRKRGVTMTDDKEVIDFEAINSFASNLLIPDSSVLSYDHLIIVPCMNLGAFPFYLLRPNDKYLVDYLSYSIAPSLIEVEASCKKNEAKLGLNNMGRKIKYNFEKPLLVANPQYPTRTSFIFPDLPGAKKEVEGSLKFFEDVHYK